MATLTQAANLTPRQAEIYDFLKSEILGKGIPPTIREIGDKFKIHSPNGVMCHIKSLIKKGLITQKPNLSRSISLVDRPSRKTELVFRGSFNPEGGKIKAGDKSVDFMDVLGTGDHFAFQFSGDCAPNIQKGDMLICRPQQFYRNGSNVVVTIDGKTQIKVFAEVGDVLKFESLDGKAKAIVINKGYDKVAIEGLVLSLIRKAI